MNQQVPLYQDGRLVGLLHCESTIEEGESKIDRALRQNTGGVKRIIADPADVETSFWLDYPLLVKVCYKRLSTSRVAPYAEVVEEGHGMEAEEVPAPGK